jgi:PHP family Zn ribbon phosphoesterase
MDAAPGQHFDFTWPPSDETAPTDVNHKQRPWLGVHFECCDVYVRIYREADEKQYAGRCPKCGRQVRLGIGPDGVASRLFHAKPI